MQEKIIFNNSKGNKLVGILSNPSNSTDVPIVILCHGLNSGKDSNKNVLLTQKFSEKNIATFRFDFFAHRESEGKVEERSVREFVDNILQAIYYIKERGFKKIRICGTSFGGVAGVIAVSKNSEIEKLALICPGMGQTSRNMSNYKKDFEEKMWIEAGKRVKIPTLIIHGSEDKDVELQFAKELSESIQGSKLEVIQGADHKYSNPEDFERMINLITEFVSKNL